MEQNTKCPACGGLVAPFDYVCDFCGNVIFNNIKTTDGLNEGSLSFDEGMGIVKENLNALHDIPKPSIGIALKSALRILLAIYTFGIILIFWRRPKKRFNNNVYSKLKHIISRNISFLKISSKGSSDLMLRINVVEEEMKIVEKQVKQGILAKNIAYFMVFALFITWFSYVISQEPRIHCTYKVTPYDSVIQGNLGNHIRVIMDTSIIKHRAQGESFEWELDVKLNLLQLDFQSAKNTKFKISLILADERGVPVTGFEPAEMSEQSKEIFRAQISNKKESADFYRFYFKNDFDHPDYMDTIPVNAVKYIIRADSVHVR